VSSVVSLKYLSVELLIAAYWESTLKTSVFLLYFVYKVFFLKDTQLTHTYIHTQTRARAHIALVKYQRMSPAKGILKYINSVRGMGLVTQEWGGIVRKTRIQRFGHAMLYIYMKYDLRF